MMRGIRVLYFGHGDNHEDELIQAASQNNHTAAIIIGGICLLVALILFSRYMSQRRKG